MSGRPDLKTYADRERAYDRAIPQEELDRLRHGSAANAEIVKLEDSLAFLLDEYRRMRRSARRWRLRGNNMMELRNLNDAKFYRVRWKLFNTRRNTLRADRAAFANGARVLDQIAQVMDGEKGSQE